MTASSDQAYGQDDPVGELTVISERIPPPSQANDAIVLGGAIAAALGGAAFGIGLAIGAPLSFYGGALAIGLFSLGIAVRRYFTDRFPDVEAVEPRVLPGMAESATPVAEVQPVARRSILGKALIAAAGVFGLSLAVPVASLGPAPGDALTTTAWRRGTRLVTDLGTALRPDDVALGGISTVWPEGAIGDEFSSVVLVRLAGAEPQPPTNPEWVVENRLIAYSKVCTHAGCPVGLFRERDNALFCPCHQSTYDAARGAVPTFGPTARALPQLPLGLDGEGYLIALGDFTEQVGPAYG